MLLADLREIQQTYSGTDELSQHLHELDERLNAEAEAVQELIAQNARVAQNQDDYNAAYDAAVSCYEATKAERERWLPTSVSAASAGGNSSGLSRNWKSCPRRFRNLTTRSGAAW